jgi:hypothetical protein
MTEKGIRNDTKKVWHAPKLVMLSEAQASTLPQFVMLNGAQRSEASIHWIPHWRSE